MWMQDTYEGYEGKYWSLPPRKILPKPYEKPHPPMWYAAGNTSSYAMAAREGPRRARVLGRQHRRARAGASRRTRATIVERGADRRVRERQRDGHQRGVRRRGPRGRGAAPWSTAGSTTCRATCSATTTPSRTPTGLPQWPELLPDVDRRGRSRAHRSAAGHRSSATPTTRSRPCQALGERRRRPARRSASGTATQEETLETIRLMGEHVIPKIDTDPVHRTTRFRRDAGADA